MISNEEKPFSGLQYNSQKTLDTLEFLQWIKEHGLSTPLALHKVEFDPSVFLRNVADIGYYVVPSSEGLLGVVQENGQPSDLSKSSGNFILHTDGPYYKDVPEFVILHCDQAAENTVEIPTILRDTSDIISGFSHTKVQILQSIQFIYHGRNDSKHPRPLVEKHPFQRNCWISNFGGRGHFICTSENTNLFEWHQVCNEFLERVFAKGVGLISHNYEKNDLIFFDNNRFLHGRENKSNTLDHKRRLNRIWIKRTKESDLLLSPDHSSDKKRHECGTE